MFASQVLFINWTVKCTTASFYSKNKQSLAVQVTWSLCAKRQKTNLYVC